MLARILTENIVPFWNPATIDQDDGGYRINHDLHGRWKGRANKGIVSQARTLWFFSRLAQSVYGSSKHLEAAAHGFSFLGDCMWDHEFGGFFWEVDASGKKPIVLTKHTYAQVTALYALSEYARASGDDSALALCRKLHERLEEHAHDERYGGYREFLAGDWSRPAENTNNPMGRHLTPDMKTANSHLHAMEALTIYVCLTQDAGARERLIELIMINSNAVVRKTSGATTPVYSRDWTPLRGRVFGDVIYGYELKLIWLLVDAGRSAHIPNQPLLDLYRTLFGHAVRYGLDRRHGGFYEAGRVDAPARRRAKVWWTQAEALMASLHMYYLTGDATYFTCFQRTLDWVHNHQVDWQYGEWFMRVEHGKGIGDKADGWKDAYHGGRAMIDCLEILEREKLDP
jgi:mannobiose 2-epimerase